MIAHNSHARLEGESWGEGEEETGDQRKEVQEGTLKSVADVPIGHFRSGVWDARDMRRYRLRCVVSPSKKELRIIPILSRQEWRELQ